MTRLTVICSGLILMTGLCRTGISADGAKSLSVSPKHKWTNVFAGRKTTIDYQISSEAGGEAALTWTVQLDRAVIARGERQVALVAGVAQETAVDVELPKFHPVVMLPVTLTISLRQGQATQTEQLSLQAFSLDVVANREQWLKSLEIVLFDPGETTETVFKEAGIPYQLSESANDEAKPGLLIHGSGIEPARVAASWQSALEAAQTGRRVLVLGSPGATVKFTELMDPKSGHSVSFRQCNVIRQLNKHLDADEWPAPGKLVTVSMHGTVQGESAAFEFRDDDEGWPWLDLQHPNGGRLIWIGVGLIESWESTPAARYLLIELLEELTDKNSDTKESKHVAP